MKTSATRRQADESPDYIARYFLRRLAKAHRDKPDYTSSALYTNALLETILIFVLAPMAGLASLILIPSLRWSPTGIAKWFGSAPWFNWGMLVVVGFLIGHLWLGKRLRKYRENCSEYLLFDTKRDARIIFWQRFGAFLVCGIIVPLLAMLVTFGPQVITRAFELR